MITEERWETVSFILVITLIAVIIISLMNKCDLEEKIRTLNFEASSLKTEYATKEHNMERQHLAMISQSSVQVRPIASSRIYVAQRSHTFRYSPRTLLPFKFPCFVVPESSSKAIPPSNSSWIKRGKEILADCHRGKAKQANQLLVALEYCQPSEIEPQFTTTEAYKYIAQSALAQCRQGDFKSAYNLKEAIEECCLSLSKINCSLTKEEVVNYIARADRVLARNSTDEKSSNTNVTQYEGGQEAPVDPKTQTAVTRLCLPDQGPRITETPTQEANQRKERLESDSSRRQPSPKEQDLPRSADTKPPSKTLTLRSEPDLNESSQEVYLQQEYPFNLEANPLANNSYAYSFTSGAQP